MTLIAKLLRGFMYVWVAIVAGSVVLSWIGTLSPFNLWNYLLLFVVLAPAAAAYVAAEKLDRRARPPEGDP